MLGEDELANKAIDEAKKIVEEDAETFVDEVIPPLNPCEEKDYIQALGQYMQTLMLLGSEGSTFDKVEDSYKNIVDQCSLRLTLDVSYNQTETADNVTDTFIYEGYNCHLYAHLWWRN